MRCYNGAPDKNLQTLLEDSKLAHEQLKALGLTATYFPVEQKWIVFRGIRPISDWFPSARAAANHYMKEQQC